MNKSSSGCITFMGEDHTEVGIPIRHVDMFLFPLILTLSPPHAGFPAQGKSVSNTMRRKSGEKNMADNSASYRGRFRWRGVFLLQLGSQINFPNSQQEKRWWFHLKILSYCEFFKRYTSPFLNVFE